MNRNGTLEQARAALSQGQIAEAGRICLALLRTDPDDVEVRHLLGLAHALAGDHREGLALLQRADGPKAQSAELHFGLGLCRMGIGDAGGAIGAFNDALTINPRLADALNNLGVLHDRLGQLEQAAGYFRRAAAVRPGYVLALSNLGDVLLRLGRAPEAIPFLQEAVARQPQDALIHADLGAALLAAGQFVAAVETLQRALELDAMLASAAANLGEALRQLHAVDRAALAFQRALSIRANVAEAHLGLGRLATTAGNINAATAQLARAVELSGNGAVATAACDCLDELGAGLHLSGQAGAALAVYDRILRLKPGRATTLSNRGRALETLGRYTDALDSLEQGLAAQPGDAAGLASLVSCALRVCDWNRVELAMSRLRSAPEGLQQLHPFVLLSTNLSPGEQSQALRERGRLLPASPRSPAVYAGGDEPLKVAYVSPDFRDHAVAHALAGIIDRHDRRRVSTVAISLAAPDNSPIGTRLRRSFDEFIDAASMDDAQIVSLLTKRRLDIAIDLAGHTIGARPGIFAHRPAPVQVSYLGFPASTGLDFMDYLIADKVVVPAADDALYVERIVRMPHCYLPFDDSRERRFPVSSRADAGLPASGFVFCAFNNGYKITRTMFEVWMSLLRETPDSVLWLRRLPETAAANLASAARTAGVATERLIYAAHVQDLSLHVARLRLADLFLDTLPYGAHSSAAEALWAGLPVLTCRGETFAGRVGASLLGAVNMAEMICENLEAYRTAALRLTRAPDALTELRSRLENVRASAPLFDTERYTRDLEARYCDLCRKLSTV